MHQGNVVLPETAVTGNLEAPVTQLDSDKGRKEVVGVYDLKNVEPNDVYNNLQGLFNRSIVRQQNNNANPMNTNG